MYFFLCITIAWLMWFVWEHYEAYGEIGEEKMKHIFIILYDDSYKNIWLRKTVSRTSLKRMMGNPNCVFDDFLCAMKITYLQPPENEYF